MGGGDNFKGGAMTEPPMTLFDLPYDPLARIIGQLGFKDQMSLRPVCRRSRDLTVGPAMASRLAHVLFFRPSNGMEGVCTTFFPIEHPRDLGVGLWRTGDREADAYDFRQAWPEWWNNTSCPVLENLVSATVHCAGFAHSSRLAVAVFVHYETYVKKADTSVTGEGQWGRDRVQLRFEVTAEGGVEGIAVGFREGFAGRRAAVVGELLGEVLKDVADGEASLSTASFENCDWASRRSVMTHARRRRAQLKSLRITGLGDEAHLEAAS